MKYSECYLINHDIDWFCRVNDYYIHVASAGGMIPSIINDSNRLRDIQYQVEMLGMQYDEKDIEYDEEAIAKALGTQEGRLRDRYKASFLKMARKGFISIDRTSVEDPFDNRYHIVCRPKRLAFSPSVHGLIIISTQLSLEKWIHEELPVFVGEYGQFR